MDSNTIFAHTSLPKRIVAFTHCFRMEAGGAGQSSKGLYRVHQFSKVENFIFAAQANSEVLHLELVQSQIEMFSELGLHFR